MCDKVANAGAEEHTHLVTHPQFPGNSAEFSNRYVKQDCRGMSPQPSESAKIDFTRLGFTGFFCYEKTFY